MIFLFVWKKSSLTTDPGITFLLETMGVSRSNNLRRFRTHSVPTGIDGQIAFRKIRVSFEKALASCRDQLWESSAILAGQVVQIKIVGQKLTKQITPAISHLLRPGHEVKKTVLRLDLWNESETSVPYPNDCVDIMEPSFWTWRNAEHDVTFGAAEDRFIGYRRRSIFTWLDRRSPHVIGWVGN
jgi:hypothetical protein